MKAKVKAKPQRRARLTRLDNWRAFLTITVGKQASRYYLERIPGNQLGGLAYRFAKLNGQVYDVQADPATGHGQCGCMGHSRYGYCKHTACLLALGAAGKL